MKQGAPVSAKTDDCRHAAAGSISSITSGNSLGIAGVFRRHGMRREGGDDIADMRGRRLLDPRSIFSKLCPGHGRLDLHRRGDPQRQHGVEALVADSTSASSRQRRV